MSKIIEKIERRRSEKNIRKQQMAQVAGISPSYYCKIIQGVSVPSLEIVESLAEEVGYKLVLFVED